MHFDTILLENVNICVSGQGFQAKNWPNVKKKFNKTPLVESRSFITFSDIKTPK